MSYLAAPQAQQSFPVASSRRRSASRRLRRQARSSAILRTSSPQRRAPGSLSCSRLTAASAGICTVSGSTVSLVGAGTCVIDADQAGNGDLSGARRGCSSRSRSPRRRSACSRSTSSRRRRPARPSAARRTPSPPRRAPASRSRSRSSPRAPASARSPGNVVSFVGAGTCTIDANQAGDGSYRPRRRCSSRSRSARSRRRSASPRTPPVSAVVGGPTYTVSATATSGLAVRSRRRAGERRDLHGVRRDRLVRRRGQLHDQREPVR